MWNKIKSLLFRNTTVRQTVTKNAFWLTVSNFGGRLLRAGIIIYAARVLGTTEWGIFSYVISFVTLITVFTDAGISPLLIRESSKSINDPSRQQKILSTSFFLKIALILIGIFIIIKAGPFATSIEGVMAILPIAAFLFAFDNIREFGSSVIRAAEKMEWETGLFLLTNLAIVILGFLFLSMSPTVEAFTYAYTLGTGVGMMVTLYSIRNKLAGIFSNFSFPILKFLLVSGWPLAISAVLGMLMINTDIILIGFFQSAHEVGLYSAAQRIIQLLYLVPGIIAVSILPSLSRFANKEDEKLRQMLELVLSFIFLVAIPITVGGIILGTPIIEFVFGSAYLAGASSFKVLIATILIDFPVAILANVAFAYNKQKNLIVYSAIGGVSNIILDLILIPRFGIIGSAWATLIAQFISVLYLRSVVGKLTKIKILPRLKKIIVAAGIMAAVVATSNILGIHVAITVIIGIIVYFGVLFGLKEFLLKEIRNIAPREL